MLLYWKIKGIFLPNNHSIILDKNMDTIPCTFHHYVAGGSIPGFVKSNLTNSNCNNLSSTPTDTYYKPWTTVGVNLKAYVGDSVTVICAMAKSANRH